MTIKSKNKNPQEVKDLRPKDLLGLKGHGHEPKVPETLTDTTRTAFVGKAINWYNYFCTNKEAKQFLVDYLESTDQVITQVTIKKLNRVADSKVRPVFGWMSRLSIRGLELTEIEKYRIHAEIERLINNDERDNPEEDEVQTEADNQESKRNVQQVMRERASDVAGELQGMIDEYISSGCKSNVDVSTKVVGLLSEKNIMTQHTFIITDSLNMLKNELQDVIKAEDEQLVEGYSHLSKTQIKNLLKFTDQLLGNVGSYSTLKQTTKAKRTKKPVSVEKIVSKLKYMKRFKDDKARLNLESIEPTKLHNCTEAWIYDTAKRKLYHYVADEITKCLIVKGSTLLGFDTKASEAKILRKPGEQLKEIMGSKPGARKFFKDIKALATVPNGRINDKMIILRAF